MDEWNWNPDDYMSYQEELIYRREEEGPFSVEVDAPTFEDSDLTF